MKINKFWKIVISMFVIMTILLFSNLVEVKAVLQANGNTPVVNTPSDWMGEIRNMEALGGAMGLNETFDSNWTSSSVSNSIDVHMQKNTEYGALLLLSASSYGNPNAIRMGDTTTGNSTGVDMIKLTNAPEWVSATIPTKKLFSGVARRYYNVYDHGFTNYKKGDAMLSWHGGEIQVNNNDYSMALYRNYNNSIFYAYNTSKIATYYSRAVVVQGEGF